VSVFVHHQSRQAERAKRRSHRFDPLEPKARRRHQASCEMRAQAIEPADNFRLNWAIRPFTFHGDNQAELTIWRRNWRRRRRGSNRDEPRQDRDAWRGRAERFLTDQRRPWWRRLAGRP
jgi:hypothetical protein